MHYTNELLPNPEREGILREEEQSILKINQQFDQLHHFMDTFHEQQGITPPLGLLEDCGTFIRQHHTLKYYFPDELRLKVANLLLRLYIEFTEQLAVVKRSSILLILKIVLKKRWKKLPLTIDWRPFWAELIAMSHREERYDTRCAVNTFIEHRDGLVMFLFNCRHYIDPLQTKPDHPLPAYRDSLITYAMQLLENIRVMSCVEGLLLLVFCLNNDFPDFLIMLPRWLDLWSLIDNNRMWDYCWLLILGRAIKHPKATAEFHWKTLIPFLMTKAKFILEITPYMPVESFPKGFPTYYEQLLRLWHELDFKIVIKFTKLLFHVIMSEERSTVHLSQFFITPPHLVSQALKNCLITFPTAHFPGITEEEIEVKASCLELCQFFQSIRVCLHPSNAQANAIWIARFVEVFLRCIVKKIGVAIAETIDNQSGNRIDDITWNTFQYLQGVFFIIIVESMNSTNFTMQGLNAISLNHLISLNPLFTHLISPFLLDAFEPKSISQPQRVLSALNAFSRSMRAMLFPNPFILQYLPALLKLALPGIDPSDGQKTIDTLDLFISLFYRLPIHPGLSSSLVVTSLGSYSNLLPNAVNESRVPIIRNEDYVSQLDAFTQYLTTEWVYEYLHRIFNLIEGLEKGNHKNGLESSDLVYRIIYSNSVVFEALIGTDAEYFAGVEEKVLQYVLRVASSHVSKISGKLIVSIIANRPSRLEILFPRILDEEMLHHTASEEKMRYRLLLAGACCRMTLNQYTLPVLKQLYQSPPSSTSSSVLQYDKKYLYHKEVKVRKAYIKLVKDILKGLVGVYPVDVKPTLLSKTGSSLDITVLASPVIPKANSIAWNIPTKETLSFVIDFLKLYTTRAKEEIQLALRIAVTEMSENNAEKFTAKKCEEMLSINLTLLMKIIRGSAEILGDIAPVPTNETTSDERYEPCFVVNTGRERLLAQLPYEDQYYLCSYRKEMLGFLHFIMQQLKIIPEKSPFYILHNHLVIAKVWIKTFTLLLFRRVAYLKNSETLLLNHNFQKAIDGFVLHRTIYNYLKYNHHYHQNRCHESTDLTRSLRSTSLLSAEARSDDYSNLNYWKFHDRTMTWIGLKVWLQHSLRGHILGYNSIQFLYTPSTPSIANATFGLLSEGNNPLLIGLEDVYQLCAHEYDLIGSTAVLHYINTVVHASARLFHEIMKNLFLLLLSPTLSYYEVVSILEISKNNSIVPRWSKDLSLKLLFFQALPSIVNAITRIVEPDKRSTATLSLTFVVMAYCTSWGHTKEELSQLHKTLIPLILQHFGVFPSEDPIAIAEESFEEVLDLNLLRGHSNNGNTMNNNGNNTIIRFDLFYGYLLLHLLDRTIYYNITFAQWKALWQFVLQSLMSGYFQPIQLITEAMAVRLIEIVYQLYQENPITFSVEEKYLFVKETLSSFSLPWPKLFLGLAHCRAVVLSEEEDQEETGMATGGGRAGWGPELEILAHATDFLKIVKTRFFTSKLFEYNLSSDYFNKELCSAFYSLVECKLVDFLDSAASLQAFFQSIQEIPFSNEGEKKSLNYLQAEIFAAFLRSFIITREAKKKKLIATGGKDDDREDIEKEKIFCQYLLHDVLETIPLEYGRDWQESISFAFEETAVEEFGLLQQQILDNFRQALIETASIDLKDLPAAVHENAMMEEADEGEDLLMEKVDETQGVDLQAAEHYAEEEVVEEEEGDEGDKMIVEEGEEEDDSDDLDRSTRKTFGTSSKSYRTMEMDEGFARRSKIFMFAFGLLNGDCVARVTLASEFRSTVKAEMLVANEIFQILIHPDTNVLSPYHTSRYEFASIVNTVIDFFSYHYQWRDGSIDQLPLLYAKIVSGVPTPSSPFLFGTHADHQMAVASKSLDDSVSIQMTISGDHSIATAAAIAPDDPNNAFSEDGSSSPPRKKTMLTAPSSSVTSSRALPPSFHQSWDQQSIGSEMSRSQDNLILTYSTDSSALPSSIHAVAPAGLISQSTSLDYSIAQERRNTMTTPSSLLLRSTDSNDDLLLKPPKPPQSIKQIPLVPTRFPPAATIEQQQILLKQTIDTIHHILQDIVRWIPIQWISPALLSFYPVLLQALIHSEVEVVNKAAGDLFGIVGSLFPATYLAGSVASDHRHAGNGEFYQSWIDAFQSTYQQYSFSWKIKAMILQLATTVLNQHWFFLSLTQRQMIKTMFMSGIQDDQLNIRGDASTGMIAYLGFKTPIELREIAELYTRNSEKLATREKNKRKILKSTSRDSHDTMDTSHTYQTNTTTASILLPSSSALPDSEYMLNIQMISCIIIARPYDLPSYVPRLIGSFLRHRHYYDINKLIITKTIQMFQESHHDRWEEFQLQFTNEQLMDLQGVGAATYFT